MSAPRWYWLEDDIFVGVCGLVILILVVGGYSYGMFRYGRYVERKALTSLFITMTEATYNDGYNDGGKVGYAQGKKAGLKTCDDVLSNVDDGGHR